MYFFKQTWNTVRLKPELGLFSENTMERDKERCGGPMHRSNNDWCEI